jgi:hypothetical protein
MDRKRSARGRAFPREWNRKNAENAHGLSMKFRKGVDLPRPQIDQWIAGPQDGIAKRQGISR